MNFPITYSRLIARELQLDEAGQCALLAGTRLLPADLVRLDGELDPATQFIILRNALALSGNPALGLQWGSHLHISSHGAFGAMIANSPDLETALECSTRYYAVRASAVALSLERHGKEMAVVFDLQLPPDEIGRFFLESVLAATYRNIMLITGNAQVEFRVELDFPVPEHADSYSRYFDCPCRFDCRQTAIFFPAALASLPNPYADLVSFEQARLRCAELAEGRCEVLSWTQKTRNLLRQHPGQLWTSREIAEHFHLSPRTLLRHLKEEGSSYQEVLDVELGRLAREYLKRRQYTVESTALTLGYQDTSSFRRAFKRWFGKTPQEYVAQQ